MDGFPKQLGIIVPSIPLHNNRTCFSLLFKPHRPAFLKFILKEGESSKHMGMIPNEVTTNLGLELPYTCY